MIIDPTQTGRLHEVIEEGEYYGMQTFDQALLGHLQAGRITMEDGAAAPPPTRTTSSCSSPPTAAAPPRWTTSTMLDGRTAAMSGNGQNAVLPAPLDGSGPARQIEAHPV